jgi:hypothetical protein
VESRTGDTSSSRKSQAAQGDAEHAHHHARVAVGDAVLQGQAKRFPHLRCVMLDEWHELMSSKRGTQTELCMAICDRCNPTCAPGPSRPPWAIWKKPPKPPWAWARARHHSLQPEAGHRDYQHSPRVGRYLSLGRAPGPAHASIAW